MLKGKNELNIGVSYKSTFVLLASPNERRVGRLTFVVQSILHKFALRPFLFVFFMQSLLLRSTLTARENNAGERREKQEGEKRHEKKITFVFCRRTTLKNNGNIIK